MNHRQGPAEEELTDTMLAAGLESGYADLIGTLPIGIPVTFDPGRKVASCPGAAQQ